MTYTGGLARTKRDADAKENTCRFLLLAQQRAGRLPDFTPPGQEAPAPGQGVAAQPAPGGGAEQADP